MAEDLKSKMAAIAAAKEGRAKQAIEAKLNAEIGEAQEAAGQENTLRDKATALEARVGVAEQSAKEAEEAIRQAQGMLAEGGLEPEEQAIIESGIAEEQQKIEELNATRTELADIKAEIGGLNTKPDQATTNAENVGTGATSQEDEVQPEAISELSDSELAKRINTVDVEFLKKTEADIKTAVANHDKVGEAAVQELVTIAQELEKGRKEMLQAANELVDRGVGSQKGANPEKIHKNIKTVLEKLAKLASLQNEAGRTGDEDTLTPGNWSEQDVEELFNLLKKSSGFNIEHYQATGQRGVKKESEEYAEKTAFRLLGETAEKLRVQGEGAVKKLKELESRMQERGIKISKEEQDKLDFIIGGRT